MLTWRNLTPPFLYFSDFDLASLMDYDFDINSLEAMIDVLCIMISRAIEVFRVD